MTSPSVRPVWWKSLLLYVLFLVVIIGIILSSFTLGRLGMSLNDLGHMTTQQVIGTPVVLGYIAPSDGWITHYQVSCVAVPNDRSGRQLIAVIFLRLPDPVLPAAKPVAAEASSTKKKKGKDKPTPTPTPLPPAPTPTPAGPLYNPDSHFMIRGITFNTESLGKVIKIQFPNSAKPPGSFIQFYDLGQKVPLNNLIRFDRPILESFN